METTQIHENPSGVVLAFRLGWSCSEFMGRARHIWRKSDKFTKPPVEKTLIGFDDDEAPRFTYSDRYFSEQGGWWQTSLHIVSLAEKLSLFDEDDISTRIKALPGQIYALSFKSETKANQQNSPRDFYDLLEPWTRNTAVKLATYSDSAALAFKVGGQIADTYWFMRGKEYYGQPRNEQKDDSWHQLLNHRRIITIIEDVKHIEDEFPPLVGECLRFTLYNWMIAHDLDYQNEFVILIRAKNKKNPNLEREKEGILKQLDSGDEAHIINQLSKQAKNWYNLTFGIRSPESYLNSKDRWWAIGQAVGIYTLFVFGTAFGLALVGILLIPLLGTILSSYIFSWISPAKTQPDDLKTSVEIITKSLPFITGAIVFVASLLRDSWSEMQGLWGKIYIPRLQQKIKEATLINWQPTRKK